MLLIAFNKPFDVLCQFRGHRNDSTLSDFIKIPGVYPAGRLDKDSEGLLLLTDHGGLQHRICQPENKMPKSYWVQVEGNMDENALRKLSEGIELKDGPTRPARARVIPEPVIWDRIPPIRSRKSIPTNWIDLTITEGRNRQIRRMTAKVGYPTLRLIRYRIGPWYLNDLQPGEWQERTVPEAIMRQLVSRELVLN